MECAGPNPIVVLEFDQTAPDAMARRGPERRGPLVRITTMRKEDSELFVDAPLEMEVGDFAVLNLHSKPLRAFSLPPGHVETRHNLRLGLARAAFALFSLSTIALTLVFVPGATMRALLIALAVSLFIAALSIRRGRLRAVHHVYRTQTGQWPFSRLLDERPALQAATLAVEQIKEEYGRLLSDVVERIEHPALFDPAVETTRRFTSALIQWDQGESSVGAAERSEQAARVRLTFDAARQHATKVGMDHLPSGAREPAMRAVKALRLAASTSNTHERETALRRGMEILDSLMLYYLPKASQLRAMIDGRVLLALPGRRMQEEEPPA